MNIYSKYLIEKKRKYFLLYHSKISKKSPKICTCQSFCLNPSNHRKSDSIPLNGDSFQRKIIYNFSEKNINFKKNYSISPKTSDSNLNRQSFSLSRDTQNKSTYANYINLNKSQYYYNGNEIGNCSSYKINNYNNSMYIKNDSKKSNSQDKKYVVRIKLSSNNYNMPNFLNNNSNINNKNSYIIEYSNNITNNNISIKESNKYRYNSYKNLTISNQFNNDSSKNIKNLKSDIIRENKNITNQNKENVYNINNKLLDQEIIDYLNKNNKERENIIKKIMYQKIYLNKRNLNNKNKVISLNNLNNYSYINNNYNYFYNNNHSSSFNNSYSEFKYLSNSNTNNNLNKEVLNQDKNKEKATNTIYSINLKKKVQKDENKNNPQINYNDENINIENIVDPKTIINKNIKNDIINIKNCSSNKTKSRTTNTNISSGRNRNIPENGESSSYYNSTNSINNPNKIRNNSNNINKNVIEHCDTDRTSSSNYSLNGNKLTDKNSKNKKYKKNSGNKKINKNIIQKSLNLILGNDNSNNKKMISSNIIFNINEKKNIKDNKVKEKEKKIRKIPMGINHKINNSFNSNLMIDKKINNMKQLRDSCNEINIQINKKYEKKDTFTSETESLSQRFSAQSINDSKIMELANNYITDDNLNRDEIKEILNSKKENKEK